jgi:hypothetical protein
MNRRPIPIVRTRRFGAMHSLGDSCVSNTVATSPPKATTQPVITGVSSRAVSLAPRAGLKGLGRLGTNTGTGGAALTALGVSGSGGASGAIGGAAKGAAIGSAIVPGIGTAIGAVIGAIAGGLIHTSQFPAWLAEDTNIIKVLQQLPAGFQGRTLPLLSPTTQNPLTLEMIWTAIIVTGNMYAYVSPSPAHSPSDMANEFNWVMAWIKSLLTCMNQNPVGANLTVSINAGNGVNFSLTFDNPGLANTAQVTQVVIIPAYLAWCTHNGAVDTQSNHCPGDASNPLNQLVLELMTDYQIAQVNPSMGVQAPAPTTSAVVTPKQTATVTVSTPATAAAPAASTTVTAGNAVTTATPQVQAPPIQSLAPTEDLAPIQSLPSTINISSPAAAPAPIEAGLPVWVYLAAGAAVLYVVMQKKK